MKTKIKTLGSSLILASAFLSSLASAEITIDQAFYKFNQVGMEVRYDGDSYGPVVAEKFSLVTNGQIGKINIPKEDQILMAGSIVSAGGTNLHVDKGSVTTLSSPDGVTLNFNSGGGLETGLTEYANKMFEETGSNSVSDFMDRFKGYSEELGAQPADGTYDASNPNNLKLIATPYKQYSYINIPGSVLSSFSGISVITEQNQTVIVNVDISSGSPFTFYGNSITQNVDVVYNFVSDSDIGTFPKITFSGGRWDGAILAPNNDINTVHGSTGLIVGRVLEGGDAHLMNPMTMPCFTPVPEPGSIALALCAGTALLGRRRTKGAHTA